MGNSEDFSKLADVKEQGLKGNTRFYNIGLGIKYNFNRWGCKLQLDYYQRREDYLIAFEGENSTGPNTKKIKTLTGPRLIMGLFYRF